MISNKSKNILTIGTDTNGKGGIASSYNLIQRCSRNLISLLHIKKEICLRKTALSISALLRCCYYCIFKPIRIVHIHTASFTDFYRQSIYVFCAKVFRKKVILHIHGAKFEQFYENHRSFVRFVCHKADVLVTVSNYFIDYLKEQKLNNNIFLLPNVTYKPSVGPIKKNDQKHPSSFHWSH